MIWLKCLLFAGFLLATDASPPTITPVPEMTLRKDKSTDSSTAMMDVSDPEGDSFTCVFEPVTVPFTKQLTLVNTVYMIALAHTDGSALTAAQYTLVIKCTDATPDSSNINVIVRITSASEVVSVDVKVKNIPQTVLHTVTAPPELTSSPITCTSTTVPTGFTLDANDCTIRNTNDLRSMTLTSSYSIDIVVSDGPTTVTVNRVLSFLNPNEAPVFSAIQAEKTVPEDVPPGTTLVTFPATDSETFTRTISVDSDQALFHFDETNGVVTLASGQSLDYETGAQSYIFTCVADDKFQQSTATVTVSLADANDAPVLSPASFSASVQEMSPATMALTLPFTVSDQDGVTSTSHKYSVKPGEAHSQFFSFSDQHQLVLTNLLDLHLDTVSPAFPATIHIVATDDGQKTATAQVVVYLTDANDNDPEFVDASLSMIQVYAGMAQGTVLGQVEATDADTGANAEIEFSLVTPNPHPGLFGVLANGQVSLLTDLAEDYGTPLRLEVKATDKGLPPRSSTALITLQWNGAPEITNLPANAKVMEKLTIEVVLKALVTSDPEGDTVTLKVTDVTPASEAFVVRNQEVVYTGDEPLDSSTLFYTVTVTASDGKGGESSGILTVEVAPNLPPASSCVGSVQASVDVQTANIDDVIKTITVTDPENDVISFAVTSTPSSGSFRFHEAPKEVLVTRDLKQEATLIHQMQIDITDSYNTVTCTVTITLTNTLPLFAQHSASVPFAEDVTPTTSLFEFDVTHTKPFTVRWEVDPAGEAGLFSFDDATRTISLASGQSFDYERTQQYVVTCIADDSVGQSSSSVTISIQNENEAPTLVSGSVHSTVEEGPASTIVFTPNYEAQDPDGDTLTYVLDTAHTSLFSIDSTNGELTNSQELDRDDGNPAQLTIQVFQGNSERVCWTVRCQYAVCDWTGKNSLLLWLYSCSRPYVVHIQDPGGLSATVDVVINMEDINDNPPEFAKPKYSIGVGLNSKQGLLETFVVTDKDDGTNAEWDIAITDQNPNGYMRLEPDGRLFLTKDMDLAYGTIITLDVEAADKGKPKRTSTAVVEVFWKPGPTIDNLPAVKNIAEDAQIKTEVSKLDVTKSASDLYLCVFHSITPQTTAFDVEDVNDKDFRVFYTGAESLSSTVKEYVLTTRCYDDDGEDLKELTIKVQMNTPPVLTCNPPAAPLDAAATGADTTVYEIQATDNDVGDSVEYSIVSSIFKVGEYSGTIKTSDTLKKTTIDEESVSVSVSDTHGHTSTCIVNFILTNVNKVPQFTNLDLTVEVFEHPAAGSALYTISVEDPNIFDTNIRITMTSDHNHKFVATAAGLEIAVKLLDGEDLDYEAGDRSFTLKFTASDGYLDSTEGTLIIKVLPKNEPPYFDQNLLHYDATFDEISTPHETKYLGCNVKDPDENDDASLSLAGSYAGHFTIDGKSSCQLTLNKEIDLDAGMPRLLNLTLVATDKRGLTAEAEIDVTINEINDNDPMFSPKSLDVMLFMEPGDIIGTSGASDEDVGNDGKLSYTLIDSPQNGEAYISFLSTGEFMLKKEMEGAFSPGDQFKYVIQATDHGNPARSATSTVHVVYNPLATTTPPLNTTTTTTVPTTTTNATDVESTTAADDSIWDSPVVIGLAVALGLLALMLGAIFFVLACKYFGSRSPTDAYKASRVESPPRNNRVSVSHGEDTTRKFSQYGRRIVSDGPY